MCKLLQLHAVDSLATRQHVSACYIVFVALFAMTFCTNVKERLAGHYSSLQEVAALACSYYLACGQCRSGFTILL